MRKLIEFIIGSVEKVIDVLFNTKNVSAIERLQNSEFRFRILEIEQAIERTSRIERETILARYNTNNLNEGLVYNWGRITPNPRPAERVLWQKEGF